MQEAAGAASTRLRLSTRPLHPHHPHKVRRTGSRHTQVELLDREALHVSQYLGKSLEIAAVPLFPFNQNSFHSQVLRKV